MRVLIMGGDGYLGWPTAMYLSRQGHEVDIVDNYVKREITRDLGPALFKTPSMFERTEFFKRYLGYIIEHTFMDCTSGVDLKDLIENGSYNTIIHYAELPSAPYSMMNYEAAYVTLNNNLNTTLALAHAVLDQGDNGPHIIKLGSMGEYGTPNYPIKEGWLDINWEGGEHRFMYPAQPNSLYHMSKIADTHLLWLYCRTYGLAVTNIMQGPVWGIETDESALSLHLATNWHYDELFGTVINRFVAQAVIGMPLTVYGAGGQTRGYISLRDVMKAVELLMLNPAKPGEFRVVNQITGTYTVNELANQVADAATIMGLERPKISHIHNPRQEAEEHQYNVESNILPALGLEPTPLSRQEICHMIERVIPAANKIDPDIIMPTVVWNGEQQAVDRSNAA